MGTYIHIEELLYVLLGEYPNLVPGEDYLLSRALGGDREQLAHAVIHRWVTTQVPQPSIEQLHVLWYSKYQRTYAAWHLAAEVRDTRDKLIVQADALINKAIDAGQDVAALRAYRQALRDVPQQAGFPLAIDWPAVPA